MEITDIWDNPSVLPKCLKYTLPRSVIETNKRTYNSIFLFIVFTFPHQTQTLTNSVILLEDANHKYGSGYVRTPEFEKTNEIKLSLTIQVTGFNNATSINNFLDQTFKFGVSLLNKDNEVINDTDLIFEHKITQSDCDNKYFSSLNNYTTNPSEAKTLDFTYSSDTPISKISVNYLSKPHYVEKSKDNGINLEIFSLIVKK